MLNPVDISGSDHQNDIAIAQPILSSGLEEVKGRDEGGREALAGDAFRKSLCDSDLGVEELFPRSEDGGNQDFVGVVETGGELIQELFGAGGLMGLEKDADPGVWEFFPDGAERHPDGGGVVGVVVDPSDAVAEGDFFIPTADSLEVGEGLSQQRGRDFEVVSDGDGGERVFDVMTTGNF